MSSGLNLRKDSVKLIIYLTSLKARANQSARLLRSKVTLFGFGVGPLSAVSTSNTASTKPGWLSANLLSCQWEDNNPLDPLAALVSLTDTVANGIEYVQAETRKLQEV